MSALTAAKTRIQDLKNSISSLTPSADLKKQLKGLADKTTRGYGAAVAEKLEGLATIKALSQEIADMKAKDFENEDAFTDALMEQRSSLLTAIDEVQSELNGFNEEDFATSPEVGNVGVRNRKLHVFTDRNGTERSFQIGEIAKGFCASKALEAHEADASISLAAALRTFFSDDLNIDLAKDRVFEIYRPVRPAVMRRLGRVAEAPAE